MSLKSASVSLKVHRMRDHAKLPSRATDGSVGYDLYATEKKLIPARHRELFDLGITVQLPPGTYGRIAPRSYWSTAHGIDVGAGVIDRDYRGEVRVLLFNHSTTAFQVEKGDRIAQLILERVCTPDVVEVDDESELEASERGAGGFGSTGR